MPLFIFRHLVKDLLFMLIVSEYLSKYLSKAYTISKLLNKKENSSIIRIILYCKDK